MHILTFWVEGVPQPVVMRYRDVDRALGVLKAFRDVERGTVDLLDDFAAQASVPRSRTLVVMYVDLERDVEAQIAMQAEHNHASSATQQRPGLVRPL